MCIRDRSRPDRACAAPGGRQAAGTSRTTAGCSCARPGRRVPTGAAEGLCEQAPYRHLSALSGHIRDIFSSSSGTPPAKTGYLLGFPEPTPGLEPGTPSLRICLLYTSDAADDLTRV